MVSQRSLEAFCQVTATDHRALVAPPDTPPPRPCRFHSVQQRNVALAGGAQTLDANESEEWLLSQARQRVLIIVKRVVTRLDFRALKR
jgi:hypothetical protein